MPPVGVGVGVDSDSKRHGPRQGPKR